MIKGEKVVAAIKTCYWMKTTYSTGEMRVTKDLSAMFGYCVSQLVNEEVIDKIKHYINLFFHHIIHFISHWGMTKKDLGAYIL